jgi:hypothetical protein
MNLIEQGGRLPDRGAVAPFLNREFHENVLRNGYSL